MDTLAIRVEAKEIREIRESLGLISDMFKQHMSILKRYKKQKNSKNLISILIQFVLLGCFQVLLIDYEMLLGNVRSCWVVAYNQICFYNSKLNVMEVELYFQCICIDTKPQLTLAFRTFRIVIQEFNLNIRLSLLLTLTL